MRLLWQPATLPSTLFLLLAVLVTSSECFDFFGLTARNDQVRNDLYTFRFRKDAYLLAGRDHLRFAISASKNALSRFLSPSRHPLKLLYVVQFEDGAKDRQEKYREWFLNSNAKVVNKTGFSMIREPWQLNPMRPMNGPTYIGDIPIPNDLVLEKDDKSFVIEGYMIRVFSSMEDYRLDNPLLELGRSHAFNVVTSRGQEKLVECHDWMRKNHPETLHRWKTAFPGGGDKNLRFHVINDHILWRRVTHDKTCSAEWFKNFE